jgi:hypothetical protein
VYHASLEHIKICGTGIVNHAPMVLILMLLEPFCVKNAVAASKLSVMELPVEHATLDITLMVLVNVNNVKQTKSVLILVLVSAFLVVWATSPTLLKSSVMLVSPVSFLTMKEFARDALLVLSALSLDLLLAHHADLVMKVHRIGQIVHLALPEHTRIPLWENAFTALRDFIRTALVTLYAKNVVVVTNPMP